VKQESETRRLPKKQRKEKIMMTTVMALAVVAVMIAKAINVNNHIEMGK
jgi:hypothetical protein